MQISQVQGHTDSEGRYNIEFQACGYVFVLLDVTPEDGPTIATEVYCPEKGLSTMSTFYLEWNQQTYRVVYRSRMTDLIILEPLDEGRPGAELTEQDRTLS